MTTDKFIELNRQFFDYNNTEDDIERRVFLSYIEALRGNDTCDSWDDVLKSPLLVILGEAGSGKTREMKSQSENLQEKNEYSFFIRLDRLILSDLKTAISPRDGRLFEQWVNNRPRKAYFFLDSVDEAKFRTPHDFETALNNFTRCIGWENISHIQVVISSRISEWRRGVDAGLLLRTFAPIIEKSAMDGACKTSTNGMLEESLDHDRRTTIFDSTLADATAKNKIKLFRVVQLQPLNILRIKCLASHYIGERADDFVNELDRAFALEFARRPIDVVDLINYWKKLNKLGDLKELIEFHLVNNLRETPEREYYNQSLPLEQARNGAEFLAAAAMMSRCFNFAVPGDHSSVADETAIDALRCVPQDCPPVKVRALLNRPIFDSATYGRIRFHHRRLPEYLAACWLNEIMKRGCPYSRLHELFFGKYESLTKAKPSLQPVLAWLGVGDEPWNEKMRNQISESAPGIYLKYGDPSLLPVDYRRKLLTQYVTAYDGRNHVWTDSETEALIRFSSSDMAGDISGLIKNRSISDDIRFELLLLIKAARLKECTGPLLQIISDANESDTFKTYCVFVIGAIGEQNDLTKLWEIVNRFEQFSNDMCDDVIRALYPQILGPQEIITILERTEPIKKGIGELAAHLKSHLEQYSPVEHAVKLIEGLTTLTGKQELQGNNGEASTITQNKWLATVALVPLMQLLRKEKLTGAEITAVVSAVDMVGKSQITHSVEHAEAQQVTAAIRSLIVIKQAYFWHKVAKAGEIGSNSTSIQRLFDWYDLISLDHSDIDWLLADVTTKSQPDRTIAFRMAVNIWLRHSGGKFGEIKNKLREAAGAFKELEMIYTENIKILRKRLVRSKMKDYKYRISDKIGTIKTKYRKDHQFLKSQCYLWRNINSIRSGKNIPALAHLAREANGEHNRWGAISVDKLVEKYGRRVAFAAIEGWKVYWRNYCPLLPHAKPDANKTYVGIAIGLSGLNMEFLQENRKIADLSPDEALLAMRYAVNEMNSLPGWVPHLAQHHPEPVASVLRECINGEWQLPVDMIHHSQVIGRIRHSGSYLTELIANDLIVVLQRGDPKQYNLLSNAINTLLQLPSPPLELIGAVAAQRVGHYGHNDPFYTFWMAIWFQIDSMSALGAIKGASIENGSRAKVLFNLCSALDPFPRGRVPLLKNPDYIKVECLREFIPLVYSCSEFGGDSQNESDEADITMELNGAQRFRSNIFPQLASIPGREADIALRSFAESPEFVEDRDWILHQIDLRAERMVEHIPWDPADILDFWEKFEKEPRSDHELFPVVCRHLNSIKDEVEHGNRGWRDDIHKDQDESRLRKWIAGKIREACKDMFTVPQEEEIDQKRRLDIQATMPGANPITIEIKLVDQRSIKSLTTDLREQLVAGYMRSPDRNYGIYVLGYKGAKKYWEDDLGRLSFKDVCAQLIRVAEDILSNNTAICGLEVVGIDFSEKRL